MGRINFGRIRGRVGLDSWVINCYYKKNGHNFCNLIATQTRIKLRPGELPTLRQTYLEVIAVNECGLWMGGHDDWRLRWEQSSIPVASEDVVCVLILHRGGYCRWCCFVNQVPTHDDPIPSTRQQRLWNILSIKICQNVNDIYNEPYCQIC